jgi:cell division septation protein DedD
MENSSGRQYRVQVGVFSTEDRASQVASDLRARGQQATVVKTTLNGREAWRVQAGLFNERVNAEKLAERLRSQGVQASVVPSGE